MCFFFFNDTATTEIYTLSLHDALPISAEYKHVVLGLIFLKYISDSFEALHKKLREDPDGLADPEDKDEYLAERVFWVPKEARWKHLQDHAKQAEIGKILDEAMEAIEKENISLKGVLPKDYARPALDKRRLGELIDLIGTIALGDEDSKKKDILGRVYEYFLGEFADAEGKKGGQFYTPRSIVRVLVEMLEPYKGRVYDPCCGSGGLLIKCELEMEAKMLLRSKDKYAPLQLHGQEFTPSTWAMSKMNMVIHDMEGEIEIGDTLKNPKFREGNSLKKFDRVVANPMWNQGRDSLPYISDDYFINDELERFPAGSPGGKIDWGWMQHIYSSLNDNGKAAVVLDTGAASRGSGNQSNNKEKDVRKWFIEHDLIEGVIYLPENLFYNTSAPGIILFLNKQKPAERKNKIYLVHAGKEFEKGDPKNYITPEGIERIAETFKQFKDVEKFARLVDKDEIVKNDYNISPSRYIQINDAETYRPIGEIVEELNMLEEEAAEIDKEVKSILEKLGV